MKKAKKKKLTLEDLGPIAEYSFRNIETPGADISFNYEGFNFGPFVTGRMYDMPKKVADHLNGLSRPKYEYRPDPVTGQMKTVNVGSIVRFACIPTGKVKEAKTNTGQQPPPAQNSSSEQSGVTNA